MAIVHPGSVLTPTKLELMQTWLPAQSWFDQRRELEDLASFRFDDPAGRVGLEAFLLGGGASILFVPLTYRDAPLEGGESHLLGTIDHSALGQRWVYDGCGDPVFVRELARAMVEGTTGVDVHFDTGDGPQTRATRAQAQGSGGEGPIPRLEAVRARDEGELTIITGDNPEEGEIVIARVIGTAALGTENLAARLTARWGDGAQAIVAGLRTP